MPLLAPLTAVLVAIAGPAHVPHKKHRHAVHTRIQSLSPRPDAAQRRVARLTRLAALVQREALLHDFIVAARTETPVFRDDRIHPLAPGIEISATMVALDFVGSPIIRARVKNVGATSLAFVLTASVVNASGLRGSASTTVTLEAGQVRMVELLCPAKLLPASLIWRIVQL